VKNILKSVKTTRKAGGKNSSAPVLDENYAEHHEKWLMSKKEKKKNVITCLKKH